MTNFNPGPSFSSTNNDQLATQGYVGSSLAANLGLTGATQTQSQVIENQTLNAGNSLTLASFIGGPGILTKFHFIVQSTTSNLSGTKGLLFSFFVDGESSASLQFEADLWGASQFPSVTTIPSVSTPFVYECDHLVLLLGKDGSNNIEVELIFKYPVPFGQSLTITVLNQSFASASFNQVWAAADAQMGISTPRRLRSSTLVSSNVPLQIPSAVEWNSGTTYVTGNLTTLSGVLYQCVTGNSNSQPPNANWSAVSTTVNPNFNTGYPILSVSQPCWLVHFSLSGQGPVNGGTYGSINNNSISFLESNLAVYDGNLSPIASFTGASPTPTYNSSGTEDFFGGSFYWNNVGSLLSTVTYSSTPVSPTQPGKTGQLRHGFIVSNGNAFMAANVDLLSLTNGGIRCGTSCLLRWEEGNSARAISGPITANNTWKICPTVLYYV